MKPNNRFAGKNYTLWRANCLGRFFIIIFTAWSSPILAQKSLSVVPIVIPPYSPNLDVWVSNPSRVLITITNFTGNGYDIRLSGSAKNNDGSLSLETKDDAPVPSIHVNAFESKQLNLNDFRIFDPNAIRFKGTSATTIARTHLLPDGVYQLCIQALDYRTRAPLSESACATFQITNADAPILISPANKNEMEPDKLPFIQFQWIAPAQAPPTAFYELSLIELPPKLEAEAGFRMGGMKELFHREVRGANMLMVQNSELHLEHGKSYAWRIQITDPMNTMSFQNNGYSEAWSFQYGGGIIIKPKLTMPDTLIAGTFAIVVESWDDSSKSINPTLPSGTGCIKFNCTKSKKIIPPYWINTPLKTKSFNVINTPVSDSLSQIHVSDALRIDKNIHAGDKLNLDLPSSSISKASQLSDVSKYLGWLKGTLPAGCILVAFHDVVWTLPNKKTVVLTGGSAYYPTASPTPAPPAMLVLDSGFTLAIDSLILSSSTATVQGKLLLPKNIISADTCTRAFLKLPNTTITSDCEFYKEVVTGDSSYGKWYLGNTGILASGSRYVIDFSSTQSPSGFIPPLDPIWKGVVLRQGTTIAASSRTIISNRGYTKAGYNYSNAKINSDGFEGTLVYAGSSWLFTTLEPYGYVVEIAHGSLSILASSITGGGFQNGGIWAPVIAMSCNSTYEQLDVQSDMDLMARVSYNGEFRWGEFTRTATWPIYYSVSSPQTSPNPDTGSFYLSASQRKPYYPADSNWHNPILSPRSALKMQGIQGITFPQITNREFTINTTDVPGSPKQVIFHKDVFARMWLNVIRSGVHAEIKIICDSSKEKSYLLGDSLRVKYSGKISFNTDFGICPPVKRSDVGIGNFSSSNQNGPVEYMPFQFVESSVWNSELAGEVKLPAPASINVKFKNMMFTSTADCAGGQVDLSHPDTLPYWGVSLVAKDTAKSAGLICARLGVIYLTAAGIAEPRHYSKPFWLTWGELKADGNLGKLYFDYNSVGQRMDGFPFSPSMVRLSDYSSAVPDSARILGSNIGALTGFLHSYGCVSIHFFGGKMLSLSDYNLANSSSPYLGRWMRVQQGSVYGAPASDIHWKRNWGGGIANFDYTTVLYDSAAQNGFYGTGTCTLLEITGGISSVITIRADRLCFSMSAEASHDINLAVVANFSSMAKIWGCGCIVGESLERVVVGGELSTGTGLGASLAARAGAMVAIKFSFLPTQTRLSIQGDMYAVLASSINAEVSGMAELVEDHGAGYVEGYLKGTVQLSTFLTGVSAEGELQWHFGLDYQMIQGRVAVGIYGPVQLGVESGVFLVNNCPKEKIWVTDGIDGRFAFNKGGLPARLSGMYCFISISQSVNLYIVSGGYEVYVGVGAFLGTSPPVGSGFGVMGNVGIMIWGEILGGLVSASAWGDLQFIAGIPPAFEGTIGLEACVVWVFCGSVDVHCGYNQSQGFYLN